MNYRLDEQTVAVTRDFLHRGIHVYKTPRTTLHTKSLLYGYMDTVMGLMRWTKYFDIRYIATNDD